MSPTLTSNQIVIASSLANDFGVGDVVMIRHDGLEKIKRISAVDGTTVTVTGDNATRSTDSRHFGAISTDALLGKVIFPRRLHK